MPCNSNIPPDENDYNKYISKVIRHLLYLYNQLNVFPPSNLTRAYTQAKFTNKDGEYWINVLCERLSKMSKENKKLILHKKDSKKSQNLLKWWENHQKMDNNV